MRKLVLLTLAVAGWAAWRQWDRSLPRTAVSPAGGMTGDAATSDSPNPAERLRETHEAGAFAGVPVGGIGAADDSLGVPAAGDDPSDLPVQPGLRDAFRGA